MPSVRTQFSVGLFVVLGMAVVVVFILWLGLMQYFQEGRKYVAFFDESVQGLSKDSAVKYRGVDIGRVDDIRVAPDGRLVQILLDLRRPLKDNEDIFAQIKAVGITGIMFVELEHTPKGQTIEPPELSFEPQHPVIPTKPSEIKQLLTDVYDIMDELKKIEFNRIAEDVSQTLAHVNQTLEDAQVGEMSKKVQKTLTSAQELIAADKWQPIRQNLESATRHMDRLIRKTEGSIDEAGHSLADQDKRLTAALEEFRTAVADADRMFTSGSRLIDETDRRLGRMHQQMSSSLRHMESVTSNLNRLIEKLVNQPSQLLFSDPPAPKPLKKEGSRP